MCDTGTKDPLTRKLFRDYRLTLVSTAFLPAELAPGMVVVTYPSFQNRTPVVYLLADIVAEAPVALAYEANFKPIELTESSLDLEASAAIQAAGVLGPSADPTKIRSALTASRARRFKIALDTAYRTTLKLAAIEQALRATELTATGVDLWERGCVLHLVTQTIAANQVTIEGDAEIEVSALANVEPFASGEAKIKAASSRKLVMERAAAEMVIGFAALKIVRIEGEPGLLLSGLERALDMRGGGGGDREADANYSEPGDFAVDSLFVALKRPD